MHTEEILRAHTQVRRLKKFVRLKRETSEIDEQFQIKGKTRMSELNYVQLVVVKTSN